MGGGWSYRTMRLRILNVILMWRHCSMLSLFALALSGCLQPAAKVEPKPMPAQSAPAQTEVGSLVGAWQTMTPDEPQQTARVELRADEHWSFWPLSRPQYVDAKKPSQSGTWFVRKGKVFLLVEESESDKIIPGMAFAFDIKSVSGDAAAVLWGGLEVHCRRIH
jgi:hypothetical protein